MLEPEEVSAILRLKELGWGAKRISRELGISRNTAKDYIATDGWTPYRQPQRKKALDGQEAWLRERLRRHRGNADVIRQELAAEKGIIVSDERIDIETRSLEELDSVLAETQDSKTLIALSRLRERLAT